MVLLPVGVAPPVAAGGAAQPDPPDGLGRPDRRRRRRLLLLRMRGLSQLRLTSNIRLHVVLGEGTRVGGLFNYEYDTTLIDMHIHYLIKGGHFLVDISGYKGGRLPLK